MRSSKWALPRYETICFGTSPVYGTNGLKPLYFDQVVRQSDSDHVTVIGAGVTLHEALAAAEMLASEGKSTLSSSGQESALYGLAWKVSLISERIFAGKNIRVIDPFTIKPLDAATIVASARATGGLIITVEDHYKEGGFTCCIGRLYQALLTRANTH